MVSEKPRPRGSNELYLRHAPVGDAMDAMEAFLDAAFLNGLEEVRIIHGQGGGKLRSAVRARLKQHPLVNSFRPGRANQGGDGVTVVSLAKIPEKPVGM